ncbi:MAG: asparaginase domain-containing protein [Bdellovibrionales bacterium]
MNNKVIVLTTGGTIEKTYDERDGLLRNGPSIFREQILSHFRYPHHEIEVYEIFSMDSLDMDDDAREFMLQAIQMEMAKDIPIIVIHGTDTMDKTAQYLINNLSSINVPILLTGAMKPVQMKDTDAMQNVVEAIYATQFTSPGVYISFHGQLFVGDACRKNRSLMTFEKISQ